MTITMKPYSRSGSLFPFLAGGIVLLTVWAPAAAADEWTARFRDPPPDAGMTVYWVWFGPAVTNDGIDRDLANMKKAHIAGATLLPVYPLTFDDTTKGLVNQPFLSGAFLELLGYAAKQARDLGLSLDVTLGTGWPYGGPWIPPALGGRMIRLRPAADRLAPDEDLLAPCRPQAVVPRPPHIPAQPAALGGVGLVVDPYNAASLARHLEQAGSKLAQAT